MITITDTEHVVRMIFPDSLKKDGGIHSNAFKLRQWPAPKGPEQCMLSDLAAKTLTTVDSVCSQYRSQRN